LRIVSFDLEGDFAAFKDPSVTTNQTVTVVPSKSALIGLLGALLGVKRSNSIYDGIYSEEYLNLFKSTSVGIKLRNNPEKLTYYTNHRSLKEAKTKPFKSDLLVLPTYTIFVKSTDQINGELLSRLEANNFVFSPTLGHSYCIARIPKHSIEDLKEIDPCGRRTSSVVLDELQESNNGHSGVIFSVPAECSAQIIVERHIHHYFSEDTLNKIVLRQFIPVPVDGKKCFVLIDSVETPLKLSKYYSLNNALEEAICLY
jgi:CRISPR-associated protein Cas5 subtype I-B